METRLIAKAPGRIIDPPDTANNLNEKNRVDITPLHFEN